MVTSFLVSFCNAKRSGSNFPAGLFTHGNNVLNFRGFLAAAPGAAGITGLCRHHGAIFAAVQTNPSSLFVLRAGCEPETVPLKRVRRVHSMLSLGNELLLVSTGTDCIVSFNPTTHEEKVAYRLAEGDGNTLHLNGIALHGSSVVVSMMGLDRGDKGRLRSGEVRDLSTGRALIRGLREPHSVASTGEKLFVLESKTSQLVVQEGRTVSQNFSFNGYVRGLHVDSSLMLVGRSIFRVRSASSGVERNPPPSLPHDQTPEALRSAIYAATGDQWCAMETTHVTQEIYDIMVLTEAETGWLERWLVPS